MCFLRVFCYVCFYVCSFSLSKLALLLEQTLMVGNFIACLLDSPELNSSSLSTSTSNFVPVGCHNVSNVLWSLDIFEEIHSYTFIIYKPIFNFWTQRSWSRGERGQILAGCWGPKPLGARVDAMLDFPVKIGPKIKIINKLNSLDPKTQSINSSSWCSKQNFIEIGLQMGAIGPKTVCPNIGIRP